MASEFISAILHLVAILLLSLQKLFLWSLVVWLHFSQPLGTRTQYSQAITALRGHNSLLNWTLSTADLRLQLVAKPGSSAGAHVTRLFNQALHYVTRVEKAHCQYSAKGLKISPCPWRGPSEVLLTVIKKEKYGRSLRRAPCLTRRHTKPGGQQDKSKTLSQNAPYDTCIKSCFSSQLDQKARQTFWHNKTESKQGFIIWFQSDKMPFSPPEISLSEQHQFRME